jgi:hypothetical protein
MFSGIIPNLLLQLLTLQAQAESPQDFLSARARPGSPQDAVIEWAIMQGAYLHPGIYWDAEAGSMRTRLAIGANSTIARVPGNLEYRQLASESLDEFVDRFVADRADPSSFFGPYLSALPTTCQNHACLVPDPSVLTVLGMKHAKIEAKLPVEASIVQSRRWYSGMIPILDLFNHNSSTPDNSGKHQHVNRNAAGEYEIVASHDHEAGDYVYNYYMVGNVYKLYRLYGFIDTSLKPDCHDMLAMRIGDSVARVACIAYYPDTTLENMVEELQEAMKYNDMPMVKGAASWIDRHSDFQLDYSASSST